MPLILFAFVVRVRDGLPLSASTDFEHNRELQERKQQLKTISKTLARLPERGTVKGQELSIYFQSSEDVSYMAVCHCSLPVAKAFCFLEDLRWEFTACFNNSVVSSAARPYPFLEFDRTIQKLKQQYNQIGGPTLEVTLAEVLEDLTIRPPQVINLDDLDLTNGAANGHLDQGSTPGLNQRLQPVTASGILSLVLNIVCASLNVIRGVHLIENTFQDDYEAIWNVGAFLLAFVCCVFQVKNQWTLHHQEFSVTRESLMFIPVRPSVVPPLPFPLVAKESEVLRSPQQHRPMQPVPARIKERVATHFPHFRRLPFHRPHRDSQTPGQM
ncbi:vesicle-trafficking protein SEC22c isoform X1 [Gouania willdenowi]|uniref:vesicle-trafficking protein SEC22c isoform X1 n=1 Tax=Gouania willdenowi TaxID=441366 RepID=UPI001055B1D7|nr:vesicle-trafficking protein SEC22c isoform X1 [Gouania willdenowi]